MIPQDESKSDLNTIRKVLNEIMENKPAELPEVKCGSIFKQALIDNCRDAVIKNLPFSEVGVNSTLFGMKVVLDETLPANMARIGNTFIRLTV